MLKIIINKLRLLILKRAIRFVEKCGLAVVKVKRTDGAVYLVGASGEYVRFDKVKRR